MAEKFDQIHLNIDDVVVAAPSENEQTSAVTVNETPATETAGVVTVTEAVTGDTPKVSEPTTIPINIAGAQASDTSDDDVPLVSPDADIFIRVAENVNSSSGGLAATWHGGEGDNSGDFALDDSYASSANADRGFLEAFGLTGAGSTTGTANRASGDATDSTDATDEEAYEYNDRMQRKEIIGMYKFARKSLGIRLILATLCTLMLFFVENVFVFIQGSVFDPQAHPYLYSLFSVGIFILTVACAYEQLYHGIKSIFEKDYIPESVAVIATLITLIHSLLSIIFVSLGSTRLYNFASAFILLMSLVFSYINVIREKHGFSVISSKDIKFVFERVDETSAEAEFDTFTTTTSGEFKGNIARVGKTAFVKNYFANTNSSIDLRKYLGIYYFVSLIVPFILAIVSLFNSASIMEAFDYWAAGTLLMLPCGILLSYSLPFLIANRRLFEDQVSIIGERAIKDYADIDVVAVNDTTAFPPHKVKIKNLNIYNGYTMEKVMYYATSGFSIVGGPLSEVFDAATKDAIQRSKRVKFVCTGRSYLCVKVDSDKVIFADKFGMTSQNIEIGAEKEEKDDGCIMYMAINGILCAKMYLKYNMDKEFASIVAFLNKNGTGVGIRTFDPNISNELLKKLTYFSKRNMRVIKLNSVSDVPTVEQKKDGGIVSKGLSRSLLKAVPMCKRIIKLRKVTRTVKILFSIGAVAYIAFCIFGRAALTVSSSIVGFYLAAMLIILLATVSLLPRLR